MCDRHVAPYLCVMCHVSTVPPATRPPSLVPAAAIRDLELAQQKQATATAIANCPIRHNFKQVSVSMLEGGFVAACPLNECCCVLRMPVDAMIMSCYLPVSYTHLTLPTT